MDCVPHRGVRSQFASLARPWRTPSATRRRSPFRKLDSIRISQRRKRILILTLFAVNKKVCDWVRPCRLLILKALGSAWARMEYHESSTEAPRTRRRPRCGEPRRRVWFCAFTMESAKIDLKNTIHLPRTGFSMKANLPQLEPKLLEQWDRTQLYRRIRQARRGAPTYILHDGPPYANGNIHLGHAFNKLLKDFIVKVKTMEGLDSPYVPGWDCHGLPIEIKVDSQLGAKKAAMSTAQIRAACRKYAEKYVNLQRKDFIRLGVLGRWEDPYLTMSAGYEAVIAQAFVDFLDRGYVYKGLKPVNWCIQDRTALAEAEVEYENHSSPSIWVRFALTSDPAKIDRALAGHHVYGLIWTTTPWTIPANMAIAFNPRFTYVAAEAGDHVYIVAKDLLNATAEAAGWGPARVVAEFPGDRLEGAVFRHPFLERDYPGLLGDHVTPQAD